MKTKQLDPGPGQKTYLIVLSPDEEVLPSLNEFARTHGLGAAQFSAIGAFSRATLGYFDWEKKDYLRIEVDEQVEVASLTGDVALGANGAPGLHIHCVLARRDGSTRAGHLLQATARPTLELVLTESPAHLRKRFDPEIGLALIDPASSD